ncbi:MAG: ABC transporter ATP-binding protein [Hyphomicrobiaceae bacterium]
MATIVEVSGLEVTGRDDSGRTSALVSDVSFSIDEGEVLALIGESGSGKSTIALALMGYARPGCTVSAGEIRVAGRRLAELDRAGRQRLRGHSIAYVAQSAAAAFNPSRRIIAQVIEPTVIHRTMGDAEARAKAVDLFRALALPDPETIGERFPHQVSGGQLQRLMLAMALMTDPAVVILDEPTTALDVTTQIEVLEAFKVAVRERGTTALYISHDLAVVAQMADRIVVLRKGRVQETGRTAALLASPQHAYTRSLLDAVEPARGVCAGARDETDRGVSVPLLAVSGVSAGYGPLGADGQPAIPVLRDVDLIIGSGSSVGVIGESGSGKSTLARVIAGLLPPVTGTVDFDGKPLGRTVGERSRQELRDIQIVFQMADTALNPAHTVERILARPLTLYEGLDAAARKARVGELLDMVRLPRELAGRLPSELSGGQKQRVNLARAFAARPRLILCDEVTSGLDTVVAAAILELLAELRRELGLAYLFISHDLSTVRAVCDEIAIFYAGSRVELASQAALRLPPLHPYAALLLGSIPELRIGWLDEVAVHRPIAPAAQATGGASRVGCAFFGRCAVSRPGLCEAVRPPHRRLSTGAEIVCHLSESELIEMTVDRTRPGGRAVAGAS